MSDTIQIIDLRKSYGSVEVLKGVDLEFHPGEVHALLGANGAGKSTLLGCLSGAIHPTSGEIRIGEQAFHGFTPREAFEAGTSIIYQHFQLASALSVSDNVFLGDELKTRWGFTRKRKQSRITAEVLGRIGLEFKPNKIVEDLSVGEQQGIEIARSMRREPKLLILDEPTAALGKHEVAALLALVKRLAHEVGIAVVFVTHLLPEVLAVADRVSILRGGEVLWTRPIDEVTTADMIQGISPDAADVHAQGQRSIGSALVTLESFETSFCGPLELELNEGEIVGVFGMLGSGRSNLLETIAGARRRWHGSLAVEGKELSYASTAGAMRAGVALVASDRPRQSLFADLTAIENLLMPHYEAISPWRRSATNERRVFDQIASDVNLQPPAAAATATSFSGGNAQKLVVGRWLAGLRNINLLLLDEPTQGVDIGSRAQIYNLLRRFTEEAPKRAVLFSTSDPDEAVALADRIVVLIDGRITDVVDPSVGEAQLLSLAQSVEVSHGVEHQR
jgi:ribose transport system ATP-binding protein